MGQNRDLSKFPNAITVLDNGNVGMGTTTPNSILEIKTSTATNSIRLGVIADDNRFNMISLNGVNTEGNYIGLAGGGSTDTNLFYQSGNAGSHIFRTGNGSSFTERMRISSTGSVGIGTSSPSTLLQVNTSARASGANVDILTLSDTVTGIQTSGYGVRILATSNNGQAKSAIAFEADGGTNNDTAISFYTQTSAASLDRRMIINKNGNVGIGTGSPFNRLTIQASNSYGLLTLGNNWASDTWTGIKIGAAADTGLAGVDIRSYSNYSSSSATSMAIFTNSTGNSLTERMRITTTGQLNLGTYHEQVKFCPGADSNHYLTYNSSADGLELSGYSSVVFSTLGGTERARFNINGVFTNPNQPAFSVYKTGTANRSGIMTYSTTILNRGNCVNLSNGRFTAPVGGAYQISFMAFQQTGTSGVLTIVLYRNGANTLIRTYQDDPNTGYGPHATISVVMSLNANDYIEVRVDGGEIHGNEDGYFSGFLIG